MITYISTKNREKYQILFAKAEEVLKNAANNGLISLGIDNVNDLSISTLNQYFAYLQDLITATTISENDDQRAEKENLRSYFLRLPLDEELFTIDANTRIITIPNSFATNGVGVQGDETAEIIYFSIDRYFDHMDLANEDMNIIIQWETRDENREIITGISPSFGKDIQTIPGKIIFGWPIYSELTKSPTPIRFAVRFFQLGTENNNNERTLTYSLATLPATISVGSTIDYDLINKTVQEIDKGKMITNRIKNVGIYDPSLPRPKLPIISTPLFVDMEGIESSTKVVDLPEDGGSVTLKISAHPADIGTVEYTWRKFAYDSTTGQYSNEADRLDTVNNNDYEEVTTDLEDDLYYRINSAEGATPITFTPVSIDDYLISREYNDEEEGFETKDGNYIKLYKRYSSATVDSVGIYTVKVGARAGVNSAEQQFETVDAEKATGVIVPGPLKPTITTTSNSDDNIIHVIAHDGTAVLSTSAIPSEEDENAKVKLTYNWKKVTDSNEEPISEEDTNHSFNENKNVLTIENLSTEVLDIKYKAEVTAERNKVSTTAQSDIYRITNAPEKPIIKRYINGHWVKSDFEEERNLITYNMKRNGIYRALSFSVEPPTQSDNLSYIWVRLNKQENEPNDFDENDQLKLQIDLGDFLADLGAPFGNKPGDDDIPVNELKLTPFPAELGELVDTNDQNNGPNLQFSENTPSGIYYCIVVNELNNHRVANVSPFYSVIDN